MPTRLFLLSSLAAAVLLVGSGARGEVKKVVHRVAINGMLFVPPVVSAAVGDEIVWTNEDIVPHTVTSGSFNSGEIDPGKSWSLTVKAAGDSAYKCSFHPTMAGQVKAVASVKAAGKSE